MSGTPDLVFAGNLLVDDVVHPDGGTRMGMAGGAMLYASLGASLWGARCGLVSVAGSDYPAAMLESLSARGVDLSGVKRLDRPGVRTWLLYEDSVRRVLHRLGGPSHLEVSPLPADLPERFRGAWGVHLSPMPFECQREWAVFLAGSTRAFVSVDPHEPVRETNLEAWRSLLAHVDAFFPAAEDLRLGAGDLDARAVTRRLASGRLSHVAYKRGAEGGLLHQVAEDRLIAWPAVEVRVEDATGAGDAFAGDRKSVV